MHHAGGGFTQSDFFFFVVVVVVGTLRVTHSVGMTCREFDSFLWGDADELREETCKKYYS